ncbi:Ger(x)C family spore germination protein [Clostridium sp.]|uniref:Ger(x)C family spore germination protein n=1 Tax=Clostridium sp. TaxID=1506 RepID=UPI001A450E10|nr:Ger(x)C family spore germination protein [Clostridium sp.]MBK5235502.1 Ger(x)C family spore germination protein [Clostridium sp.]
MKKNMNKIFVVVLCSVVIVAFSRGEKMNLISMENLGIAVGMGIGINKDVGGNIIYRVTSITNSYKEDSSVETIVSTGVGSTIGKTREDRQKKSGLEFFLGLTKISLADEEYAKYGLRTLMEVNFKNPVANDNVFFLMCKGKHEEYFNYKTPGYDNSADYISDMIKNSANYNFFREDYTFQNAALALDAEGKNIVSPFIEMVEDEIKINGMAVFNKDKLGVILDMKETRIMNMLRENKVRGILTIQKNSEKYINYQAESKRKISCKKTGDKYTFTIDLNLDGEIINNELYKDITTDIEVTNKFEDDMERQVKGICNEFLDKMKKEYKLDLLQLGWVAAAKYGRDTGADWNEIVSNSDIVVNVKVHVDKLGRGQY